MEKKTSEVMGLNGVLGVLAQMKSPFGILIAQNVKKLKPLIKKYEEEKEIIQDKYLKKDDEGNFIGIKKEDGKRVEKPVLFKDIECVDRKAFEKEIQDLDDKLIEVPELREIDCSKKIYWSKREKEVSIQEWIDLEVSPSFIMVLDEFGLLKNLD